MIENPESTGGMGDGGEAVPEVDRRHIRADLKMLQRAIKKRWIIPKDADEVLPNEMYQIATTREIKMTIGDGESSKEVTVSNSRAQISATKILIEMEGQNQADEHEAVAQPQLTTTGPTQINYYLAQPPPPPLEG